MSIEDGKSTCGNCIFFDPNYKDSDRPVGTKMGLMGQEVPQGFCRAKDGVKLVGVTDGGQLCRHPEVLFEARTAPSSPPVAQSLNSRIK